MDFRKKIVRYDNFLPQKMFDDIKPFLLQKKWGLSLSNPNSQSHKVFWGMILDDGKFFAEDVFYLIKKATKKNFKINQILANAQSTLQDGSPHTDSIDPKSKTFLIYSNAEWDYQWGGETIFFDRYRIFDKNKDKTEEIINSTDIHQIYPVPNTAVYFPSNMIHYAMGPNRDFYGIRYTIAYHLITRFFSKIIIINHHTIPSET